MKPTTARIYFFLFSQSAGGRRRYWSPAYLYCDQTPQGEAVRRHGFDPWSGNETPRATNEYSTRCSEKMLKMVRGSPQTGWIQQSDLILPMLLAVERS